MKKVLAINGSPRKNWNTYILLENALAGAKDDGAEGQLYNLYDFSYKGCTSCFSCKQNDVMVKKCVIQDELTYILHEVCECDAIILGSPIYIGDVSGEMRSFLERLIYPYISYTDKKNLFRKAMRSMFIYTMNRSLESAYAGGYEGIFKRNKEFLERNFAQSDYLVVTETYQFDYNKYPCTKYDVTQRLKRRDTVFIDDCKKAYEMGKGLFID